jgi:hypothetical protein
VQHGSLQNAVCVHTGRVRLVATFCQRCWVSVRNVSHVTLVDPEILRWLLDFGGPGSSVGIATGYGLHSPGIESWWGEIFHTCTHRPWGSLSLLYNGYLVLPGVKSGREVTLTPHSLLMLWS